MSYERQRRLFFWILVFSNYPLCSLPKTKYQSMNVYWEYISYWILRNYCMYQMDISDFFKCQYCWFVGDPYSKVNAFFFFPANGRVHLPAPHGHQFLTLRQRLTTPQKNARVSGQVKRLVRQVPPITVVCTILFATTRSFITIIQQGDFSLCIICWIQY